MRRKLLRGQNNKLGDKNKEKECEPYAAGSTLLSSKGSTSFFHWQCIVDNDESFLILLKNFKLNFLKLTFPELAKTLLILIYIQSISDFQ